ncbi:hypothetical protein L0337_09625, partial [candidate division KSB1 bacterium]|nr:hypothetical protein [candidate division KSB1 bacterium]
SVGFIYPLGKSFLEPMLPEGLRFSACLKTWRSLFKVKSLQKKQKHLRKGATLSAPKPSALCPPLTPAATK